MPSRCESRPDVDVAAGAGPATERGNRAVGLVARESGAVGGNQPSDLGAHGFEHLGRRRTLRHQRRHPPQRRLLLRKPRELLVRLTVRDRGRHQLGELCETILELVGERRVR